jgi:hypothetical protein
VADPVAGPPRHRAGARRARPGNDRTARPGLHPACRRRPRRTPPAPARCRSLDGGEGVPAVPAQRKARGEHENRASALTPDHDRSQRQRCTDVPRGRGPPIRPPRRHADHASDDRTGCARRPNRPQQQHGATHSRPPSTTVPASSRPRRVMGARDGGPGSGTGSRGSPVVHFAGEDGRTREFRFAPLPLPLSWLPPSSPRCSDRRGGRRPVSRACPPPQDLVAGLRIRRRSYHRIPDGPSRRSAGSSTSPHPLADIQTALHRTVPPGVPTRMEAPTCSPIRSRSSSPGRAPGSPPALSARPPRTTPRPPPSMSTGTPT